MLMKDVSFDAVQVAALIDVHNDSVQSWCRNGKLKARKNKKSRVWVITGKSLADFLYYNPKYQETYRNKKYQGYKKMVRDAIMQEIDARPAVFDLRLLCDIFDVDYETTKYWMCCGGLKPLKTRSAYGARLFTQESVQTFVDETSKLSAKFSHYMRTRKF